MLPNLTLIIAVYVVVRLATIALRQFPRAEGHRAARAGVAVVSVLAVALVTLCTLDTIGTGLSIGTTIDAKHGPLGR
jgi:hypothetical protein